MQDRRQSAPLQQSSSWGYDPEQTSQLGSEETPFGAIPTHIREEGEKNGEERRGGKGRGKQGRKK